MVPHKPFRQPFLDKVAKLSGTQKQSQEPDQPFQKSQLGKIQKTLRGKGPIQCLFASLVPVTLPRLPAEVASWDFYFIPDANLTIRLVEVAVKGTEAMAPETDSSRVEVAVKGTEEVAPEADSSQPSPPPTSPETHYNFNVSSECLISTSRVFRAMLGMSETGSGFKEGAEFAATVAAGNLHKSAPSDESPVVLTPYVLKVESDDPVALNLVLNTIHEKITPAEVPFNILYQVAVLCDKYDWIQPSSPLHLNATRWAQNLWQPKPTEQGGYSNRQELNGWLFISWVFRLPNIFESTSRRLMMRTKVITQVSEGQADEIQGILDLSPADGVASQKIIGKFRCSSPYCLGY